MGSSTTWLVANWKMHGTRERAAEFALRFNEALTTAPTGIQAVFCPPAVYLQAAAEALPADARLKIGAQDCHAQGDGAYTGEISARMLADVGTGYVILGHSERRHHGGETCAQVLEKARAALAAGLTPILCIGESDAERAAGNTAAVLAAQLEFIAGLDASRYFIAYEPLWAIGSGKTPTGAEISAVHAQIKTTLGSAVAVLYGGSVKPGNLKEILACDHVDGVLVGGASLEIDHMKAMLEIAAQRN